MLGMGNSLSILEEEVYKDALAVWRYDAINSLRYRVLARELSALLGGSLLFLLRPRLANSPFHLVTLAYSAPQFFPSAKLDRFDTQRLVGERQIERGGSNYECQ